MLFQLSNRTRLGWRIVIVRFKIEAYRVDTVALTSGLVVGVIKQMAKMAPAVCTLDFHAVHAVIVIIY